MYIEREKARKRERGTCFHCYSYTLFVFVVYILVVFLLIGVTPTRKKLISNPQTNSKQQISSNHPTNSNADLGTELRASSAA